MLDASELAQLQADAAFVACDTPCTVQRRTGRTVKASGGASTTWTTQETVNVGLRQPSAAQLQNFDYLVGSKAAWQVYFPTGTNVEEQDQLLIGTQKMTVAKLLEPNSYSALVVVLATEVV